ncbi:MAG: transposase [Planctomycetota bacterium]
MSNTKERRHFTGQEKVAILHRRLIEGVPVSALCEEHHFPPTAFYRRQKELFEQGAAVFDAPRGRNGSPKSTQDAAARRMLREPQA